MTFHSILFDGPEQYPADKLTEAPAFFRDLNLDQIVESITAGWEEYNLAPFFYTHLHDLRLITYRQEVMEDLQSRALMEAIKSFSRKMRTMRERRSQAKRLSQSKHAMNRRLMSAVETYCEAVEHLTSNLETLDLSSPGLRSFHGYLKDYAASIPFRNLLDESTKLRAELSAIRYCVMIKDDAVTVYPFHGESDHSIKIEEAFEKFTSQTSSRYELDLQQAEGINHIEAQILDRVALLLPATFGALDTFCAAHADYLDRQISRFDREIQFYVAYLTYIENFQSAGLSFCRPQVSQTPKETSARNAIDLALAGKLTRESATLVSNDFSLTGPERILVVTGPNQGGKTTFARMFGQIHYLASLGCLVPGTDARLFVFDRVFTHFGREENIANLRGRLQDDLVQVRKVLEAAMPRSLVVMNEVFSSTTLTDALYLSRQIMEKISRLDLLCVWVTFLDELASFNEKTVSVVSAINPEEPAARTFKFERRPADGLAYALAIAQKHHVTYDWLKERIKA